MRGRLIAVVGPSGVGKDSVMEALGARSRDITLAKRVITRPSDAGGEDFHAVTLAKFGALEATGAFALSWHAHGLSYGIPAGIDADLAQGRTVLANLSRSVLAKAAARFHPFSVLSLTASPEVLQARLQSRGRETEDNIKARLARAPSPMPSGLNVLELDNSGALGDTVEAAFARLYSENVER